MCFGILNQMITVGKRSYLVKLLRTVVIVKTKSLDE